jgi:2-oxoglutarate-dependent dioxygenase
MTMTIIDPVAPTQLTDNEIRFYNEEGYLYLPGVIDAATVAALQNEVYEVMAASGRSREALKTASGVAGKLYQSGQYLKGSALDGYINSPQLCSIAAQLMGGASSLYMPFTAVKSGGGGGTFHFHQDNQYTRFDGPGINLWLALSPMSPENGCLMVVPRSHLAGTIDGVQSPDGDGHRTVANDPTRFLPIRMNSGDVIAFSRLTLHGSGPNHTDEPRLAYAVQFYRDDVKAVWDGQPPRLLKGANRWNTAPVEKLSAPDGKPQDGH